MIVAEKLMGLDPTAPEMTLLLVMLHTGTMFAVIVYLWTSWRSTYFASAKAFRTNAFHVVVATMLTGLVGLGALQVVKHFVAGNASNFEVEHLFGNSRLMAAALAAAGVLIVASSRLRGGKNEELSVRSAAWIGAVQGLCLPFRGFSRSGATISTGLILGVAYRRAEEFSFALAVVLTPAVVVKEAHRLYKAQAAASVMDASALMHIVGPSLLGMLLSFLSGLVALHWLSRWLEQGRWYFFGGYCLVAAMVVLWVG